MDPVLANSLGALLKELAQVLGLLNLEPTDFLQMQKSSSDIHITHAEIDSLIQERIKARLERNWARADEIRTHLQSLNIMLEDLGESTTWRRL